MLPEIKKTYLIAKFSYDVFDEILVFLTNEGEKLTCFSAGSRKIASKNGRNLIIGNFLETEYFPKTTNKLNRLKKVNLIRNVNFFISNNYLFYLLNLLFSKIDWIGNKKELYMLYQESLALIMLSIENEPIFNYFFIKFMHIISDSFKNKICIKCNLKNKIQSISIEHKGLICLDCIADNDDFFTDDEIKYIFKIMNNSFFLPEKIERVDCLNIYHKLLKKLIKYKKY